jgi:hypothetical protein
MSPVGSQYTFFIDIIFVIALNQRGILACGGRDIHLRPTRN